MKTCLLLLGLLLALPACDLLGPGGWGRAPSGGVYLFDPGFHPPARFPTGHYTLTDAAVEGDTLTLQAEVSGCEPVDAALAVSSVWAESFPPQTRGWLDFRRQDCDAVFEQIFRFDLAPVRAAYQQGYQTSTGAVIIHLAHGGPGDFSVRYSF